LFILLGVNAVSILMSSPGDMGFAITELLIMYLSYFFVIETFHPELEGDDINAVPEEFLSTGEAQEPAEA